MGMTIPPPTLPPTVTGRKRFTRDDCTFLERTGLLRDRYELIDGEIIVKVGQNRPHSFVVSMLLAWLFSVFGPERVPTQAPMEVRADERVTNRPEPDAVVLRELLTTVPTGHDVLLAVEVSDTTQGDDFGFKAGLYARSGVPEYWVIDIPRRRLSVFRRVEGISDEEGYPMPAEFGEDDTVSPLSAPDARITVRDLLPDWVE